MIDSDIPISVSRASMKQANMNLKFKEDIRPVSLETIDLVATKFRHYDIILLTIPCRIVFNRNKNVNVTLSIQNAN